MTKKNDSRNKSSAVAAVSDPRLDDTHMTFLALGRQILWYLELEKVVPKDFVDRRFAPELWAYLKSRPVDVPESEVRLWVQETARVLDPAAVESPETLQRFALDYLKRLPMFQVPARAPLAGSSVPREVLDGIAEEATTRVWPHTLAKVQSAVVTVKAFLKQHPTMDSDLATSRKEKAQRTKLCQDNAKNSTTKVEKQRDWLAQEYAKTRPLFSSQMLRRDNKVFILKMLTRFEKQFGESISEDTAYRYLRVRHIDLTTGKTKETPAKNKLQH